MAMPPRYRDKTVEIRMKPWTPRSATSTPPLPFIFNVAWIRKTIPASFRHKNSTTYLIYLHDQVQFPNDPAIIAALGDVFSRQVQRPCSPEITGSPICCAGGALEEPDSCFVVGVGRV